MDDIISRKVAIRNLCKMRCGCEPEECCLTFPEDGAEECADVRWLLSLPSAWTEQRWIPRKTALPEKGQYVLCQCRAGIMDVLRLTDDNGWYKDSTHIYMHAFVLAWMPLPEPWKGERE